MRCFCAIVGMAIVFANSVTTASAAPYSLQVGQRHPDFVLPAIDDRRPVSLSQFRGKKVLLVHFASW